MARGKAKFTGTIDALQDPPDVSEKLKAGLRKLYPGQDEVGEIWGHPADEFVAVILAEAGSLKSWVDDTERIIEKKDIIAERDQLKKKAKKLKSKLLDLGELKDLQENLRCLSPDFVKLLPNSNELKCADSLDDLALSVGSSVKELDQFLEYLRIEPPDEPKDKATERRRLKEEMAIRVLRVAEEYGMKISATHDKDMGYTSDAVKLVKILGDAIGLNKTALSTWKAIIAQLKKEKGSFGTRYSQE